MKVVIQKCHYGSVSVNNIIINEIDAGYVIFVGFKVGDTIDLIPKMVKKIINLRIFEDEQGIMNKSIQDIKGSILSISQFTLYADTLNGNRPSYHNALNRDLALPLYEEFNNELQEVIPTKTGLFGKMMEININNYGPTTIILEMNS